jgi:hypothetical protein
MDPRLKEHLFRDITSDDLLGAALRGHLWVENELIHIIHELLPRPGAFNLDRISFPSKVELAAALGAISPDDVPAYRNLNTLRNRLAHRFDSQVTEEDERSLFASMTAETREIATGGLSDEEAHFPDVLQAALAALIIRLQVTHKRIIERKEEAIRLHEEVVELLGGQEAYERKTKRAIAERYRSRKTPSTGMRKDKEN